MPLQRMVMLFIWLPRELPGMSISFKKGFLLHTQGLLRSMRRERQDYCDAITYLRGTPGVHQTCLTRRDLRATLVSPLVHSELQNRHDNVFAKARTHILIAEFWLNAEHVDQPASRFHDTWCSVEYAPVQQ